MLSSCGIKYLINESLHYRFLCWEETLVKGTCSHFQSDLKFCLYAEAYERSPWAGTMGMPVGIQKNSYQELSLLLTDIKFRWDYYWNEYQLGHPWWLSAEDSTCQCRRHRFDPWSGKIPWRRKWQPIPVFLSVEPHGQRNLEGYSPWVAKSQMWLSDWKTFAKN